MRLRTALFAAVLASSAAYAVQAAETREASRASAPTPRSGTVIAYGTDPLQKLSLWPGTVAQPGGKAVATPLIVFVHGGGWKRGSKDNATGAGKIEHYPGAGYAFASIDYRLVPQATVEQQAQDVADAVKALVTQAGKYHIDRRRIVLMGHSAGAHLVALVGTDERYLQKAGLSFGDLAGVIPIDGAAYDVEQQVAQAGPFMRKTYAAAFGNDSARQRALSPTAHAAAPNAPSFLLLHVQREDGVAQNRALEAALRKAGTPVERRDFPGEGLRGHMEINRRLGDPAYAPTGAVDAWLRRLLAARS
jgi:acetyl esterase/lipase